METAIDAAEIAARYGQVRKRIEAAARRANRNPATVTLVAVTKRFDIGAIRAALAAGARDIGENYVQEAARKAEALATEIEAPEEPEPRWHLIGHLQRNKAPQAARLFDLIHSIDSMRLGEHLDRAAATSGKVVRALIEVNVSQETTKSGVTKANALDLLSGLAALQNLRIEGMMAIPPPPQHPEASRPYFRELAKLRTDLASRGFDLPHLSMGMTDDYQVAVEEGATIVRVGRAIFGPRT